MATEKLPDNYTVAMIRGLAQAQHFMRQSDWCDDTWSSVKKVASNPLLQENRMREEAITIILDYMYLYRCPQEDISVFLNDSLLLFRIEPVIVKGRTLVSWRELIKGLGAEVKWDEESGQVLVKKGNTSINMRVGEKNAFINGRSTLLDQAPLLLDGQLMVPLRFISETLGTGVSWDGESRSVIMVTMDYLK